MARHIKRVKVNRSYDGIDREEKTGGLMFLRVTTLLLIVLFAAGCVLFFMYSYLKGEQAPSVTSSGGTNEYYGYYTAEEINVIFNYIPNYGKGLIVWLAAGGIVVLAGGIAAFILRKKKS